MVCALNWKHTGMVSGHSSSKVLLAFKGLILAHSVNGDFTLNCSHCSGKLLLLSPDLNLVAIHPKKQPENHP